MMIYEANERLHGLSRMHYFSPLSPENSGIAVKLGEAP
jgi:hypothetical protein